LPASSEGGNTCLPRICRGPHAAWPGNRTSRSIPDLGTRRQMPLGYSGRGRENLCRESGRKPSPELPASQPAADGPRPYRCLTVARSTQESACSRRALCL